MGHKTELFKQLVVLGLCAKDAGLLLEDSWRVTSKEIIQMNAFTKRVRSSVRFLGEPDETIIQASSLTHLFASFAF